VCTRILTEVELGACRWSGGLGVPIEAVQDQGT
jgi:hypothetical protein